MTTPEQAPVPGGAVLARELATVTIRQGITMDGDLLTDVTVADRDEVVNEDSLLWILRSAALAITDPSP